MHRRGSILILAVWAIFFFSILVANLAFHAGEEILMAKRELKSFRNRLDFNSGLNEAFRLIQDDPSPYEDSKDKPWYGDMKLEKPLSDRLSIHLEDEESKLDLNGASAAFLTAFFRRFEDEHAPLKGEAKHYVENILKLRYEKRIESLEELLLMEDFKKEDFDAIKPYLTVYPEQSLINLNTASPLVLEALIDSLGADHASKEMLIGRLKEACPEGRGCLFLSTELTPKNFLEKLKLPDTPFMMQLAQEFVALTTTDSETFDIVMKSKDGAEATAVFRSRPGQERPEVFWWHENV